MSKANTVLFGTGDTSADDPTGISDVVEAAEAAYEADIESGVEPEIEPEVIVDDVAEADGLTGDEGDASGDAATEGDKGPSEESEDELPVEPVAADEPTYKYASQAEAERANAELQRQLNEGLWQLRQAQLPPEPAPVAQDYRQLAQTDPVTAFNQALEAGDAPATTQITTQVANEAMRMTQLAFTAREEGDEDAAGRHEAAALSANQLAEEMRGAAYEARFTQHVQQQMEPVQAERVMNALNTAATAALSSPVFEGIVLTPEQHQDIGRVLEANPQVFGDRSPAALAEGFKQAAVHVVFGGHDQMIAHMVDKQVQAALAANPHAPVVNKSRGMAGGVGRAAPAAPVGDAADIAEIQDVKSPRINGMGVLFNNRG